MNRLVFNNSIKYQASKMNSKNNIECGVCGKYAKNGTGICGKCWKQEYGDGCYGECKLCGEYAGGDICFCYWCFRCNENTKNCKGHSWIECEICEYSEVYEIGRAHV